MNEDIKILDALMQEGMCCTSILVQLGLNLRHEGNRQLVHAVSGLCNGVHVGLLCGALSGGCCMLTLFAENREETAEMTAELANWFITKYGVQKGGTDCSHITNNSPEIKRAFCPSLIEATYLQAKSILIDFGKIAED